MIIKWVGSKRSLIQELLKHVPPIGNRPFHEPFCGAAHLFFSLKPRFSYLSDANRQLVDFWQMVQHSPAELIRGCFQIKETFDDLENMEQKKQYYLKSRDLYNSRMKDRIPSLALFLFLNKTGFNGLYRVNKKGEFNVPFGKRSSFNFSVEQIMDAHWILYQGSVIVRRDYKKSLCAVDSGEYVYLDPPYVDSSGNNFTAYTGNGFCLEDYLFIRDFMTDVKAFTLLSAPDTEFMRQTFSEFYIHEVESTRSVSRDPKSRGKKIELLIKNYD